MTDKIIDINAPLNNERQIAIVANTFFKVMENMSSFSNRVIIDGVITLLYSLLAVTFKTDTKNFNIAINGLCKGLKKRFKEDNANK